MDMIGIHSMFESASDCYVESFIERLESKIDRSGNCHEWTERTNKFGHARITFKGKKILAHRAMWVVENGEIGEQQINHSCGNAKCMNTEHMYIGSQEENAQDMAKHGNQHKQKMSVEDVKEVRKRVNDGETQISVAEDFPVGQYQISRIVNGKRWSHI